MTLPRDADGRPTVGRIPLERRIGKGGMGAVYYAVHPRLHVPVAVKILPHHLLEEDPSLADRFVSEARIAAALENENIVRVYDVDREGPTFFLVMAYVDGESAGSILRARGRLAESDALALITAATRGLAAAHARGIIHRDIKPDNILVPREGGLASAKLADLGLAKPLGSGKSIGTTANVAMGTPGYMSPEQIDDARSVGPAADVFSMGATLYALLAGSAPFTGTSVASILRDTGTAEPPPLPADVGAATRTIVARCLEKNPGRRYAGGADLLAALRNAAPPTAPTLMTAPRPAGVPVLPLVLGVLTLLAAAAAGAALLLRGGPTPVAGVTARWEVRGDVPDTNGKAAGYVLRRIREGFPDAELAGTTGRLIAIRVPGARPDDEAVLRAAGVVPTFEYREVGGQFEHLSIKVPDGFEEVARPAALDGHAYIKDKLRMRREPVVSNPDVMDASVRHETGGWVVEFRLWPEGAKRFEILAARLAGDNPPGMIAILVNGRVVAVPVVRSESFGDRVAITGLAEAEAESLGRALGAGGLPGPLEWRGAEPYRP